MTLPTHSDADRQRIVQHSLCTPHEMCGTRLLVAAQSQRCALHVLESLQLPYGAGNGACELVAMQIQAPAATSITSHMLIKLMDSTGTPKSLEDCSPRAPHPTQ